MAWEDQTWWMMTTDLRSPAESPKSVSTHEHVTCTLDAGGDAPQLTSKETRPTARYARQSTGAFADPKPHTPGRDPVRALVAMGCSRSILSPLEPRGSLPSNAKNERRTRKKDTRVRDKS